MYCKHMFKYFEQKKKKHMFKYLMAWKEKKNTTSLIVVTYDAYIVN